MRKTLQRVVLLVIACSGFPVTAQVSVPGVEEMASAISDSQTRQQALFSVIASARYLQTLGSQDVSRQQGSIQENVDWLNKLAATYAVNAIHAPVLDPATWFIRLELEQRQLELTSLIKDSGPGMDAYLRFVFNRADEHLASTLLAELQWQVEPWSTVIWAGVLEQMKTNEALGTSIAAGLTGLPTPDPAPARAGRPVKPAALFGTASESLEAMAGVVVSAGPPDQDRLQNLQKLLLVAMPRLDVDQRAQAEGFYRLARLIDILNENRYIEFAEGLLAVITVQLELADESDAGPSPVSDWLTRFLPAISTAYARDFAQVDPRLNSALAAAFDVSKDLSRPQETSQENPTLRRQIADSVAQLTMLTTDLGQYFSLPVRDSIAGGMDACTGLMASREADGSPSMTRELFDDCQRSIVELADTEARMPALSGDMAGPFGDTELNRELSITSGQRINYGIGYLHSRYQTGCVKPARPLPNPLEWSALATLLTWFAQQSPVYFQTPENEARLERMRGIGQELLDSIAQQVDCIAGAGEMVNDPVARSLNEYREVLTSLASGINDAKLAFRKQVLAPGADIALQKDATQVTGYRPASLLIGPCNAANVCEMTSNLTSTRALLGLFPDEFLIADQAGMGHVQICYENMEWVERRSAMVRPDDTNVANYFGRLAFNLKGRYLEGDSTSDIFEFRFTSPNEHHYLFGAASEEVLNDSCPVKWIGQRIVTRLGEHQHRIVPDRLTYLAAPRTLASRLVAANWDRGAEWRDWFITGIGVERLELPPPEDISYRLNLRLQELNRAEQMALYRDILTPAGANDKQKQNPLYNSASQLTIIKSLIRQQLTLFYPQLLLESDPLRTAVVGQGGLIDAGVLARFSVDTVPISVINNIAFERLKSVQAEWDRQPEALRRTGSISSSVALAMLRLNALYDHFFAPPPLAPAPQDPTPQETAAVIPTDP